MLLHPYHMMEPPHQGTFDCECYTCEITRILLYVSPEHEKLFSLLAVLLRVVPPARRRDTYNLRVILDKIQGLLRRTVLENGARPRVSLRVRTAVEAIDARLDITDDPYQAIEFVQRAALFGTKKSRLLTTVTDKTWQEQIAGRAQLSIRRDWPELDLR